MKPQDNREYISEAEIQAWHRNRRVVNWLDRFLRSSGNLVIGFGLSAIALATVTIAVILWALAR